VRLYFLSWLPSKQNNAISAKWKAKFTVPSLIELKFNKRKKHTVMDSLKALLGNGSVNAFQRETIETVSQWANVISCSYAAANASMDLRDSNHVTRVFSVVCAEPI
jgi:hypothetical protein